MPCVDAIELTEEALAKERTRSLKMLELIMLQDPKLDMNEKTNEKKGVISIPNKKNNETKNENKISNNDKMIQKIDIVNNWESIKTKRFDPTDKKQSYALTIEEIEIKNKLINEKILKKIEKDQQDQINEKVTKKEDFDESELKDNFVDLNTLKDIFYKEGGIWFGDDGTLTEAVIKGNIGNNVYIHVCIYVYVFIHIYLHI
jgi:hypothetical protein